MRLLGLSLLEQVVCSHTANQKRSRFSVQFGIFFRGLRKLKQTGVMLVFQTFTTVPSFAIKGSFRVTGLPWGLKYWFCSVGGARGRLWDIRTKVKCQTFMKQSFLNDLRFNHHLHDFCYSETIYVLYLCNLFFLC